MKTHLLFRIQSS